MRIPRGNSQLTTAIASQVSRFAILSLLLGGSGIPAIAQTGDSSPVGNSDSTLNSSDEASREDPPGRTEYLGRKIAATMHYAGAPWLIRESREREEDCTRMLENLGATKGMTICDLGCGNGFYALRLAEVVGDDGAILAVDIQPEMLRLLELRAKEKGIQNIKPILGTLSNPKLEPGSVDLILCVDVYHELSHPVIMLQHLRKSLKPEGRIVLVEFRAEDPSVPIKPLHKMTKKQAVKELRANGFRLAKEYDELPWQHMLFFAKELTWTADSD